MLNTLLSLRPLDLVEISSKDVIKEARYFSRMNMGASIDTPYWFFQRIDSDGAIVVASPSGYTEKIDATDISNVIRTDQIRTMAMPAAKLRRKLGARCVAEDLYAPASIVSAMRDRWGRFEYRVWFDEAELNESETYFAPLADGEKNRLHPLTVRTRMPVMCAKGAAPWSSDRASRKIAVKHQKLANDFIAAVLGGNRRTVTRLASLDA